MPQDILEAVNIDLIKQDSCGPDGVEYLYKDRRQELVFIGHGMKRDVIQKLFDDCLLTDEEMSLGPEAWKESWEELDTIKLFLEEGDDEEDEEDEDSEDDDADNDELSNNKRVISGMKNVKMDTVAASAPRAA